MNKILLLLIVVVVIPIFLTGCTCYYIESFDLNEYDQSSIIVEVEIVDKINDGYEKLVQEHKEESLEWDKPYPQTPLIPPNNYTDFRIKVKEIYKGQINLNKIILRANDKNSSCYWEPKINNSYILYLGNSTHQNNIEILQLFGACHRKINSSSSNFDSEKRVLTFFKSKPEGIFKINQKELIRENSKLKELIMIEGEFKMVKEDGIWKLKEPFQYFMEESITNKTILKLHYIQGKLVEIEQFKAISKHINSYFLRHWVINYENSLGNF